MMGDKAIKQRFLLGHVHPPAQLSIHRTTRLCERISQNSIVLYSLPQHSTNLLCRKAILLERGDWCAEKEPGVSNHRSDLPVPSSLIPYVRGHRKLFGGMSNIG